MKTIAPNSATVNIKLSRIELCDLLIACTNAKRTSGAAKWGKLHDELRAQLDAFDEECTDE